MSCEVEESEYELAEREDGQWCEPQWRLDYGKVQKLVSHGFRTSVGLIMIHKYGGWLDSLARIVFRFNESDGYPIGHWVIMRGYTGCSVTVSSDGRWLRMGDKQGHVTNGDLTDFTEGRTLKADSTAILAMANRSGIVAHQDWLRVRVWHAESARLIREISVPNTKEDEPYLEFDDTAETLLIGGKVAGIQVWSVKTGECLLRIRGNTALFRCAKFINDDRIIAVSHDSVYVWNRHNSELIAQRKKFGKDEISSLTVNSDESLVSVTGHKIHVLLWPSLQKVLEIVPVFANCALFHPKCPHLLAVGCYHGSVNFYDVRTGVNIHSFFGHKPGIDQLIFTPEGSRILSIGRDRTIRMRDLLSDDCLSLSEYL